ncbi:O-antigen ligase family protein [Sphingomicrobium arenosum]|uniref:O-antigen ligase family protein n=1 Tax=Sphingomicrobium arenosum TaxID=2233861 RepID=UPI0022409009|nr:O-antigen ligase family protein [Sphingomicrobium arenosum]
MHWFRHLSPLVLTIAILLGGGSMSGALGDALLAGVGAILLPLLIALHVTGRRRFGEGLLPVVALAGAIAALVLFQLMAPGSLADRPLVEDLRSWANVGAQPTLTLDPAATWRALLTALFPIAAALAFLGAGERERRRTLIAMMGLALLSSLLACYQLATGAGQLPYFTDARPLGAGGLFANVNHHGLFQALGLLAAGAFFRGDHGLGKSARRAIVLGLVASAFIGTLAGGSLAGLIFTAIAAFLVLREHVRRWPWLSGVAAALIGAAVLVLLLVPGVRETLGGNAQDETARLTFWRGTLEALALHWPWGSGLGTFIPVYASVEQIENIGPLYANHAHNEYLHIALEGGLPGIILLLLVLATFTWSLWRGRPRWWVGASLFVIGLGMTLAHGLVDYPLRNNSLAVVALLFFVFAFKPTRLTPRVAAAPALVAGLVLAALAALVIGGTALPPLAAQAAAEAERPVTALRYDDDHPQALIARARLVAQAGDEVRAVELARRSLDAAPMNAGAAAFLMLDPERAMRADMASLSRLGWRHSGLQTVLFVAAFERGDDEEAARRIGAIARRGGLDPILAPAIRDASRRPAFLDELDAIGALDNDVNFQPVLAAPLAEGWEREGQAALLSALAGRSPVAPRLAAPTLAAMLQAGDGAAALTLFRALYPDRSPLSLAPYAESSSRVERTPFDPLLLDRNGVRVARADDQDGLRLSGRGAIRRPVASRYLAVNSGQLTLSYRLDNRHGEASVTPRITCPDGRRLDVDTVAVDGNRLEIVTFVPEGCDAPLLAWDLRNPGGRFDLRLIDPSLRHKRL